MKKLMTAIAVSIALPTAAFAQAAQAPAKMSCCENKDMAECHKGMDRSKMDHSQMGHSATTASGSQQQPAVSKPQADQHQNHQQ